MSEPVIIAMSPQKVTTTRGKKHKRDPTKRPPGDTPLGEMPVGWVRLFSGKPYMQMMALLDADAPQVTAGYGGWQVLARPRRRGLTVWQGNDPVSLQVALVIDNFSDGDPTPVERDVATLERMAGLDPDIRQPPYLVLDGGGAIQHDVRSAGKTRWVISDLTWGTAVRDQATGKRLRQHAVVTLMEYITEGEVDTSEAVKHRNKNQTGDLVVLDPKNWHGAYTVKQGDTLPSIAAKLLGSVREASLLARANHIRDPKSLKVGQGLRVP